MSWITGLAGKAEDFLNRIDQNAAVALQKETKNSFPNDGYLTEVTWEGQSKKRDIARAPPLRYTPPPPVARPTATLPLVKSSPNLGANQPLQAKEKQSDEDLINFLNSPDPVEKKNGPEHTKQALPKDSGSTHSVIFENLGRNSPAGSQDLDHQSVDTDDLSSHSSRSTPKKELVETKKDEPRAVPVERVIPLTSAASAIETMERSGNSIDNNAMVQDADVLISENNFLKHGLKNLNQEMLLLVQRSKAAEKESRDLKQQLDMQEEKFIAQEQAFQKVLSRVSSTEARIQEKEKHIVQVEGQLQETWQQLASAQERIQSLQSENERLLQDTTNASGLQSQALQALQDRIVEREGQLERLHASSREEVSNLREKLRTAESERISLSDELTKVQLQISQLQSNNAEIQQHLERTKAETNEARQELDQYRVRAQRILQDKEKLISELRGDTRQDEEDDTTIIELEQLRQERDMLREEALQVTSQLQKAREELQDTERRLEMLKEQASESQQHLQDAVQEERKKRQAAEEDCQQQKEELACVRDELSRQRGLLATRVREREAELTKLRTQLSTRPLSPAGGELESRLHALTQTLVQKQSLLETLTTEKNALRLQLEKTEKQYRDTVTLLHQTQHGMVNLNDTDDAKARVPSFLIETPFDTGVARRVKRAYTSLDAVSIRMGVFLRRYPLARIFVVSYMVILHLWVLVVLLTYTPEAHLEPEPPPRH